MMEKEMNSDNQAINNQAVNNQAVNNTTAMTSQQKVFTERKHPLSLYKQLIVGRDSSYISLFFVELLFILFKNLQGILGIAFRSLTYPLIFKNFGKGTVVSSGVTIRVPKNISLGKKVIIDDSVVLDVRGDNASITIGDNVTIARGTIITAKNGHIKLADGVNISTYCRIATQSRIEIGESVLIAAYSYIGPGNHRRDDESTPLIESQMEIKGGVMIGRQTWIGAHTTILDGVKIGDEAIVGAHSLVKSDVQAKTTVFGVPAKVK